MKNLCETFIGELYQEYKQRNTVEEQRGFRDSIKNGVDIVIETVGQLCHMKDSQSCSEGRATSKAPNWAKPMLYQRKTGTASKIEAAAAEKVYFPFLKLVNRYKKSGEVNQTATPQASACI